jgi:hypothetical protein
MDRGYVSEFTTFINRYLAEHPEVVNDQWQGREIYWDRHVDFAAQEKARKDHVPDDAYGFYGDGWQPKAPDAKHLGGVKSEE